MTITTIYKMLVYDCVKNLGLPRLVALPVSHSVDYKRSVSSAGPVLNLFAQPEHSRAAIPVYNLQVCLFFCEQSEYIHVI